MCKNSIVLKLTLRISEKPSYKDIPRLRIYRVSRCSNSIALIINPVIIFRNSWDALCACGLSCVLKLKEGGGYEFSEWGVESKEAI